MVKLPKAKPVPDAKVIVSPAAGDYSTHRKWPRISKLLEQVGLSFDYEYTEGVGYADGELLGTCPASFWLMPSALNIVV